MFDVYDITHLIMTHCKCYRSCTWCYKHQYKDWVSCYIEDMAIDMILDGLY